MFYANFILKKRGPLSRIWLAAHWDKKLTKAHIFETDIEGSVMAILSPELKLALRTSSHLLLGVVRIYSRKAKYLLADCNEALIKIKLAFRPGMVDLPAENREASLAAINIREDFTSFDLDVADFNEIDFHARFAVNQSRPEDITLREEIACVEFVGDDGFVDDDKLGGPVTMETVEFFLRKLDNPNLQQLSDFFERFETFLPTTDIRTPQKMARNASMADSGFGSPSVWPRSVSPAFGEGCLTSGSGDFGFNAGINTIPEVNLDDIMFEQNLMEPEIQPAKLLREQRRDNSEDEMGKGNETDSHSVGGDYDEGNCGDGDDYDDDSISNGVGVGAEDHRLFSEEIVLNQEEQLLYEDQNGDATTRPKASVSAENLKENDVHGNETHLATKDHSECRSIANDFTTLIENDAEVFALGPVEVNVKERRAKRKRRLVVDEHKVISSETMKSQLSDSSELVMPLDLAPPTKRLMLWKESGGVDKLFVLPGLALVNAKLFKLLSKNLFTTPTNDSDDTVAAAAAADDADDALGAAVVAANGRPPELKRGRSEGTDTNVELSRSILSLDALDTAAPGDADISVIVDSLAFDDASAAPSKRKSRRLGDVLCPESAECRLEGLPELPKLGLSAEDELSSAADGSPARKRHKQLQSSGAKSPEPRSRRSGATDPVASDVEDNAENEDAIFDVEPAPTCSERANLRQELEEAEMEEKLWNRRSTQMQHILHRKLETSGAIGFDQLTARNNRKQAASKFYTILVLTKAQSINVEQRHPYGDIEITRGSAFECIV